jgi:hypothetical protein
VFALFKPLLVLLLIMIVISLILASLSERISIQLTIPTKDEADKWTKLASASDAPEFCSLPVRMTPYPRPHARFALVSPIGTGGRRVAHFLRDVTRISVSAEDCQFGI